MINNHIHFFLAEVSFTGCCVVYHLFSSTDIDHLTKRVIVFSTTDPYKLQWMSLNYNPSITLLFDDDAGESIASSRLLFERIRPIRDHFLSSTFQQRIRQSLTFLLFLGQTAQHVMLMSCVFYYGPSTQICRWKTVEITRAKCEDLSRVSWPPWHITYSFEVHSTVIMCSVVLA